MEKNDKPKRLLSLDALRGLDMMMICGLGSSLIALCVALGFGKDCWLATQLHHVSWHGFHIEDGIFPLFLFISGASFPFSLSKQLEKGRSTVSIVGKILVRGLTLVALGFMIEGFFRFQFASLRCFSVLGRIGLSWMLAALVFLFVRRNAARVLLAAAVLLAYGLVMGLVQAPDFPTADRFSPEGSILCWFDRTFFPGHTYQKLYDPEGTLGVFTGMVTAMLGMFAGEIVKRGEWSGGRKTVLMAVLGALLSAAGWALDAAGLCPVNKALWSPSFVLLVGGCSYLLFALFYWVIDVRGWHGWTLFLRVVGMNSIAVYVVRFIVPPKGIATYFLGGIASALPDEWSTFLLNVGMLAVVWLFAWFLHRRSIYFKV